MNYRVTIDIEVDRGIDIGAGPTQELVSAILIEALPAAFSIQNVFIEETVFDVFGYRRAEQK